MADYGLFFGWDRPVPGKEAEAAELWTASMGWWAKQKEAGNCESFEPVIMGRHGGDLNGFMLVRGTAEKLHGIMATDEYQDLITKCDFILMRFGVIPCWLGDGVANAMGRWMNLIKK